MRVLRGLDSALIALHIIACSDVTRGRLLAMEELVDAIISITQFHFQRLVTVISTPSGECKLIQLCTDLPQVLLCPHMTFVIKKYLIDLFIYNHYLCIALRHPRPVPLCPTTPPYALTVNDFSKLHFHGRNL